MRSSDVFDDDTLLGERVRFGELFDCYCPLLTEKQREACELFLVGDLLFSELAEELMVSRQGAHDLVKRSRDFLEETEGYIGLLALKARRKEFANLLEQWRHELPEEFVVRAEELLLSEEAERDV